MTGPPSFWISEDAEDPFTYLSMILTVLVTDVAA